MKILITGVHGFLGQKIYKFLLEKGHSITGLDIKNTESRTGDRTGSRKDIETIPRYISCDLTDTNKALKVCNGIGCVIHLAGIANTDSNNKELFENNVLATKNILHSAIENKVQKIIFLSSYKINNSVSGYSESKKMAEIEIQQQCIKNNIKFTILRSALVYGDGMANNMSNWLDKIRLNKIGKMPKSSAAIPMVGINDISTVIASCVTNNVTDNQQYDVTDGNEYSVNSIEKAARNTFGTQDNPITYPKFTLYMGGKIGDLAKKFGLKFPFNSNAYNVFFKSEASRDLTVFKDCNLSVTESFWTYLNDCRKNI